MLGRTMVTTVGVRTPSDESIRTENKERTKGKDYETHFVIEDEVMPEKLYSISIWGY